MTATELKKRAIALAEKTKIDSVTPEEVGRLSNDIVEYVENVEMNGGNLGIRKTYTSVSAMESDSTAPKDDKGVLLRRGMLVNIYNQEDPESADNGKVFSFQNPGWAFRGTIDAGYATRDELTELDKKFNEINISSLYPTNGEGGTNKYTLAGAIAQVPSEYRTIVGLKITFINNATSKTETWKYDGGTFTTTTNWKQGDGSGGNIILEWSSDVATTRKQVLQQERKKLLQISYENADGDVINEQYVGTLFTDAEWVKDANWERIASKNQLDKLSNTFDMSGLNSLITFDEEDILTWEQGYIVSANGNFVANESFRLSPFFELQNAPLCIVKILQSNSWGGTAAIAQYDENKNYIGAVDASYTPILGAGRVKGSGGQYLFFIMDNKCKYYKVGYPINSDGTILNKIEIMGLNIGINDINHSPLDINLLFERCFCPVLDNGEESSQNLSKYSSTDFIPVEIGDIIYCNTTPVFNTDLAFYDKEKQFIESVKIGLSSNTGINQIYEYKIENETYKYVRGNFDHNNGSCGVFFIKKPGLYRDKTSVPSRLSDFEHKTKFNSYIFKNEGYVVDKTEFTISNKSSNVQIEDNIITVSLSGQEYGIFKITPKKPIVYQNCVAYTIMKIKLLSVEGAKKGLISDGSHINGVYFDVDDEKIILLSAYTVDGNLYSPKALEAIGIFTDSTWEIKDIYTININKNAFPIIQGFNIADYDDNCFQDTKIPQNAVNSIFYRIDNIKDKLERGMNVSELSAYSRFASSFWTSEEFFRKTYVSFGDSITEYSQTTREIRDGKNVVYRENNYPDLIAAYFNFKVLNLGQSGYVPHNNLTDENLEKLPNDTALVTISGGQNGWITADINSLDRSTDVGAINYAIDYIRNKFPKCIIVLVPTYISVVKNGNEKCFEDYQKISDNKNVLLADTYNLKLIDWERDKSEHLLRYDDIHLTGYGAKRVAAVVRETIRPLIF